jgi:hypothetical protein
MPETYRTWVWSPSVGPSDSGSWSPVQVDDTVSWWLAYLWDIDALMIKGTSIWMEVTGE